MPVEETPDLALGRAWRYPIAPQPLSAPLTGPRKGAPSRPQIPSKAQAALSALHLWVTNAPRPIVIEWAAVAQAALALLGALVFASLALRGDPQALQALLFASLAGVPAGMAYALASRRSLALLGALALIASQIALFAWSFALVGPRPALLLLAPALIVVAMEMSGKALGVVMAVGLGAVYAWFALIPAHGALVTASMDLIAVLAGLAAVCAALLALDRRATTAEAHAKDWRIEAERLDALNQAQRAQAEEEAAYLRATLAEALLGRGVVRVALEGPLAKLAEMVYTVASRLMTLRRDRDERVRLEGALAQLMRAVEDSSLGGSSAVATPDRHAGGHALRPVALGPIMDSRVTRQPAVARSLRHSTLRRASRNRISAISSHAPLAPIRAACDRVSHAPSCPCMRILPSTRNACQLARDAAVYPFGRPQQDAFIIFPVA